jgi:hypothetical protein
MEDKPTRKTNAQTRLPPKNSTLTESHRQTPVPPRGWLHTQNPGQKRRCSYELQSTQPDHATLHNDASLGGPGLGNLLNACGRHGRNGPLKEPAQREEKTEGRPQTARVAGATVHRTGYMRCHQRLHTKLGSQDQPTDTALLSRPRAK